MPKPAPLPSTVCDDVNRALREDIGSGDLTAALIPAQQQCSATVISRDNATLSGCAWFDETFLQLDPQVQITWHATDGERVKINQPLCTLHGAARSILSGERCALNFLQTLSATATLTQQYVSAITDTACKILDTRKTIPGLRLAQKYAVTCGGGHNHRIGLYDMILIKENHIMAAGSIAAAVAQARHLSPGIKVEVEVESLGELQQAIESNADTIMLDNMDIATMQKAVSITAQRCHLEASGGVNLETVQGIARTGVDFISVGLLTKNINAVDLSMRFHEP
ncbi:MAG: carboxylating nicotinate-nucleotide diphosphorylase [Gammaproteobacteria bacterium]|nr:carboxylating nicotinate-nucleotide diphosphorylase [Gammaproteobacteria bacterium]